MFSRGLRLLRGTSDEGTDNSKSLSSEKKKKSELALFDECIEACDSLASSNSKISDNCSVLVSPDGALLFVPNHSKDGSNKEKLDELYSTEEYKYAVNVGSDTNGGDYKANGFSTLGIGIQATGEILENATRELTVTARFIESLMLAQKEGKAHTSSACDKLRNAVIPPPSSNNTNLGPLFHKGTSLHKALLLFEQYQTRCCEEELARYRTESRSKEDGLLPNIQSATVNSHRRTRNRALALQYANLEVQKAEDALNKRKNQAIKCKLNVKKAQEQAKARLSELKKERIHQIEVKRFEQSLETEVSFENNEEEQAKVWEMIQNIGEGDMDFEPAPVATQRKDFKDKSAVEEPPIPTMADVEPEFNLTQLRNELLAAENSIEDAAAVLLNALSALDTTHRSSRVAAETNLLSAANAQKICLQNIVTMEKEVLERRLKKLANVQKAVDNLDVRQDLDIFLKSQKNTIDNEDYYEEDGGVAASMAIINSYSIQSKSNLSSSPSNDANSTLLEGWTVAEEEEEEAKVMSKSDVQTIIENFFEADYHADKLREAVESLQKAVSNSNQTVAQTHRAAVSHALNLKRSVQTELKSEVQFDALGNVLDSLLSSCDCQNFDDVANAKTFMMLAQTFYKVENHESGNTRTYLKNKLLKHKIWENENFWDQALFQCVSDSLAQSGVIESFQNNSDDSKAPTSLKWHDLTSNLRIEATSQLQALVFSQIGALAHSMIEFGCDTEMTSVFVRRMSIRHQLPITQRMVLLKHVLEKLTDNDRSESEDLNKNSKSEDD